MPDALPRTPAERFAGIVEHLCRTVAASHNRGRGLAGPLIILIWSRLRRIQGRFARLAAHLRAGTLRARAPSARRRSAPRARPDQPPPLPRGFAWLCRLVPQANAARSQLQYLLMDPEMAALVAAAPQAGRVLRPLCRMLGLRLPPELRPPPRTPPPAPAASVPPVAPKSAAPKPAKHRPRRLAVGRAPPATAGPHRLQIPA